MALFVNTNVASLEVQRNMSSVQSSLVRNFQRLSSGLRINSAADDAAGLSISESFKMQIGGFSVAERNANDGISFAQTADGGLSRMSSLIARMRDLAVEAGNGDLTSTDRAYLNTEFIALRSEIDRIASSTKFNSTALLGNNTTALVTVDFQVGIGTNSSDRISIGLLGTESSDLAINASVVATTQGATSAIQSIDAALATLNTRRETFGAMVNRLQVTIASVQAMKTNLSAANSRIRDVDVAEETAALTRNQVLAQAGAAVLAQANQTPQIALGLLR